VIPGPSELTCDQLQYLLKLVVDELEDLFYNGAILKTPSKPEGKPFRAIDNHDTLNQQY
jgi:hypothetical protein